MNIVLIVPTGIGARIGGHAGDATPVCKLMASLSDILVTHPNVVNASDINEMPENVFYVEGLILDRFLLGEFSLRRPTQNRILLVANRPVLFAFGCCCWSRVLYCQLKKLPAGSSGVCSIFGFCLNCFCVGSEDGVLAYHSVLTYWLCFINSLNICLKALGMRLSLVGSCSVSQVGRGVLCQ